MSTIHGGLFVDQYIKHGIFWMELRLLPTLRDGLWAWGVLAWTAISTLPPIRRLSYELFLVQHLISAVAFLCLMLKHIGRNNRLLMWASIIILVLDWITRGIALVWRNFYRRGHCIGFPAEARAIDETVTALTISDVSFTWTSGQHIFIWLPRLPLQTPHPFTMTSLPSQSSTLTLVMRTKKGFTKKLNRLAPETKRRLRVFLGGPVGRSPSWWEYDAAVLISSSTGASYSLSILETLCQQISRIFVLAIARRHEHLGPYLGDLHRHAEAAEVTVAITGREGGMVDPDETERLNISAEEDFKTGEQVRTRNGRPEVAAYLRESLTGLTGRVIVSVCGGSSLVADVRRAVTSLAFEGVDVVLHVEGSR